MPSREPSTLLSERQRGGVAIAAAAGLAVVAMAGLLSRRRRERAVPDSLRPARQLDRAAATLAACVFADSAIEHYRGMFHNRAMYTPLVSAAAVLGASLHGAASQTGEAHAGRDTAMVLAGATGLVGTAFHVWNIGQREGGLSWQNLFYAAPLGAPAALTIAGALGFAAERLRGADPSDPPRLLGLPAGRALASFAASGIAGSASEAALFHFRGAFQNPAMFVPITVPPVAAALLAREALRPAGASPSPLARAALHATWIVGMRGSRSTPTASAE